MPIDFNKFLETLDEEEDTTIDSEDSSTAFGKFLSTVGEEEEGPDEAVVFKPQIGPSKAQQDRSYRAAKIVKEGLKSTIKAKLKGVDVFAQRQADVGEVYEKDLEAELAAAPPGSAGAALRKQLHEEKVGSHERLRRMGEYFGRTSESEILKEDPAVEPQNWVENFLFSGPQMATQMAVGVVSAPASSIMMMVEIAGGTFNQLKAEGVSDERARAAGVANGIMQAPLEWIGISKSVSLWKTKKVVINRLKELGKALGLEWFTEFVQGVPELISNVWAKNPDKDKLTLLKEMVSQAPEALKQSAYEGTLTAPWAMLGGGAGIYKSSKTLDKLRSEGFTDEHFEMLDKDPKLTTDDIRATIKKGPGPTVGTDLDSAFDEIISTSEEFKDKAAQPVIAGNAAEFNTGGKPIVGETSKPADGSSMAFNAGLTKSQVDQANRDKLRADQTRLAQERNQQEINRIAIEEAETEQIRLQEEEKERVRVLNLEKSHKAQVEHQKFIQSISTPQGLLGVTEDLISPLEQSDNKQHKTVAKSLREAHKAITTGDENLNKLVSLRYNIDSIAKTSPNSKVGFIAGGIKTVLDDRIATVSDQKVAEVKAMQQKKQDAIGRPKVVKDKAVSAKIGAEVRAKKEQKTYRERMAAYRPASKETIKKIAEKSKPKDTTESDLSRALTALSRFKSIEYANLEAAKRAIRKFASPKAWHPVAIKDSSGKETGKYKVMKSIGERAKVKYTKKAGLKGKESIVGAAINIDGKIYKGTSHPVIINEFGLDATKIKDNQVGFITNSGRYVERSEASRIVGIPKTQFDITAEELNLKPSEVLKDTDTHHAKISAGVSAVHAQAKKKGKLKFVKEQTEIPEKFGIGSKDEFGAINAFWDEETDTTYMVTSGIPDVKEGIKHLMHEEIGHRGLYKTLDKFGLDPDAFFSLVHKKVKNTKAYKDAVQDYAYDIKNMSDKEKAAFITEEVIARRAERLDPFTRKSVYQSLKDLINNWLKKMGIVGNEFTMKDVDTLLEASKNYMMTGEYRAFPEATVFTKYPDLSDVTVNAMGIRAKTGEEFRYKEDAATALKDIDDQIAIYELIAKCVGK